MKLLKWLDEHFEECILVVLLIAMALIMFVQVVARYAFRSSLTWSEELTRYLFVWSGFLGIAYCIKRNTALRVDALLGYLPKKAARVLRIVGVAVELAFFGCAFPFAFSIVNIAFSTGRLSPAAQIPVGLVQAAPLIGFGLAILRLVQRGILEIFNPKALEPPPEPEPASLTQDEKADHALEAAEEGGLDIL